MLTEDLFCAPFAVWYLTQAWLFGTLFADLRARLQARGGWLAELSKCDRCSSFWIALLVVGVAVLGGTFLPAPTSNLIKVPFLYAPAVAGLQRIIAEIFREHA